MFERRVKDITSFFLGLFVAEDESIQFLRNVRNWQSANDSGDFTLVIIGFLHTSFCVTNYTYDVHYSYKHLREVTVDYTIMQYI
jgi:hypothetical protein